MFRHLLMILFRPHLTLNRLLEERKRSQSYAATLFLAGICVLVAFLWCVFMFRAWHKSWSVSFPEPDLSPGTLLIVLVIGVVLVGASALVYLIVSRYLFGWMVQAGLKMTAGDKYPQTAGERREKALLLRLIHPYTLWIQMVPSLLVLLLMPLTVNLSDVANLIFDIQMGLDPSSSQYDSLFVGAMVYGIAMQMVVFGFFLYMVLVRTSAIRKIYQISIAQAFWGTFLMYLLLYLALCILAVLVMLVFVFLNGTSPGMRWI